MLFVVRKFPYNYLCCCLITFMYIRVSISMPGKLRISSKYAPLLQSNHALVFMWKCSAVFSLIMSIQCFSSSLFNLYKYSMYGKRILFRCITISRGDQRAHTLGVCVTQFMCGRDTVRIRTCLRCVSLWWSWLPSLYFIYRYISLC